MHDDRLRMAVQVGAEPTQQPIIRRSVIKIVQLTGEAESRRIQHSHTCKRGPCLTGALEVRNIGCMCHFIEAARYVLSDGADRSGGYEKREHDGANTPASFGRR